MVMLVFMLTCYCFTIYSTVAGGVVVLDVVVYVVLLVVVVVVLDVVVEVDVCDCPLSVVVVLVLVLLLTVVVVYVVYVYVSPRSISLLINKAISILPSTSCLITEHINSLNKC